jgi:hypothetical protein
MVNGIVLDYYLVTCSTFPLAISLPPGFTDNRARIRTLANRGLVSLRPEEGGAIFENQLLVVGPPLSLIVPSVTTSVNTCYRRCDKRDMVFHRRVEFVTVSHLDRIK